MDDICKKIPHDPSSYSTPEDVVVTHFDLDWLVDFEEKCISGSVLLNLEIKNSSASHLVLDSRKLNISKIICEDNEQNLDFSIADHDAKFGSKVSVAIASRQPSLQKMCVRIYYSTSPCATGLQWLKPNQTSGKVHPFLFSQCQSIHARSLMPCQDTPRVKATYTAQVKCDSKYVALMSALRMEQVKVEGDGLTLHKFRQPIAVPSYLLAIVVGDLVSERLGPRSLVWAEREIVQKAAFEFAETEEMLRVAESLCGKYVWEQYDLLVLPPSFPFGGMENPCLTFVTPTLLAGDRSLADVIAHEICHSWTGNLVTTSSWEHFWLNEGFTMFLERKVAAALHGEPARHLSAIEGWESLKDCIENKGAAHPLTCLVTKLEGVDPDDACSAVPYEKGHALLWYLESLVGGAAAFNPFIRAYVQRFGHRSLDSDTFTAFFCDFFAADAALLKQVDWDAWFYTPGMPLHQPKFDTSLVDEVVTLVAAWDRWDPDAQPCPFAKSDLDKLSSHQVIVLLSKLVASSASLPLAKVRAMDEVYGMAHVTNAEVRFRWLRLCVRARWLDKVSEALDFVNAQGRMKFVRPIYRDLYKWEEVRARTIANFEANRDAMMHVASHSIAVDLRLDDAATSTPAP